MKSTLQKRRQRVRRYHRYLNASLCPECGGRRDGEGLQCLSCREKNRDSVKRTVTTAKRVKYQNRYLRKNRRMGLCAYCGRVREEGYRMCATCRATKLRKYHSDPALRLKYKKRAKYPPPVPLCQACLYHRFKCRGCGKYMHLEHDPEGCWASCVCGKISILYLK